MARASAAPVNPAVMIVTAGRPSFSNSTLSWRPHVMQAPQSPTPCTIASQDSTKRWMTAGGDGIAAFSFS